MSAPSAAPIASARQAYWDWRVALNFILGGSGAGVLIYAAFAFDLGGRLLELLGAALIAGGLLGVWSEIGRPWRAMNAFRHASTSWMSREMFVAPLVLAGALAAALLESRGWRWLAAGLAVLYVYTQGRMLNGGRGIPAWREPRTVPLMMASGLTEGAGFGVLAGGLLVPLGLQRSPALILAVVLLARIIAFSSYRRALRRTGAPSRVLRDLAKFGRVFGILDVLALAFAIVSVIIAGLSPLILAAALIAVAAGWWLKYTLVIRLSYKQPFTVPMPVVRGGQPARSGPRPGG